MRNDYLKIIFYKKLSAFTNDSVLINTTFDDLVRAYDSPRRFYHDLTHIVALLKMWEAKKGHFLDADVVYLAIWFHDAVYDAWKSDNEERSATLARTFLAQTSFPKKDIEKVVQYILATKTHESEADNPDLTFFLDADLAILGADETIYDIYAKQIRDEFSFYPSFIYNRGRKKVLNAILEKEFIYKSDEFRAKYEEIARANLARELGRL